MSANSREEARKKLFEQCDAIGVSRNDLRSLIAERQELLDKFALGFARSLIERNYNHAQVPAMAYDLAEECMRERAKRK